MSHTHACLHVHVYTHSRMNDDDDGLDKQEKPSAYEIMLFVTFFSQISFSLSTSITVCTQMFYQRTSVIPQIIIICALEQALKSLNWISNGSNK